MKAIRKPWLMLGACVVMGLILAACSTASPAEQALDVAKAASDKYHDVNVAMADGYVSAEECVASPAGAMGIHYLNIDLILDPKVDPERPEVLLYFPTDDGLILGGIEYLVAIGPPGSPVPDSPPAAPVLFDQTFDGPMEGHGPDAPPHFDLHVWVWEENPQGMFGGFNSALSCPES